MALPTTRDEFAAWILRRLGDGVTQINCSEQQVQDRIDESLQLFSAYHYDGTEKTYLMMPLTASTMVLDPTSSTTGFNNNDIITGSTSNAVGKIFSVVNSSVIAYTTSNAAFIAGETIHNFSSPGPTANISSNSAIAITLGNIDAKCITLPNDVIGVIRLLQPYGGVWQSSSEVLFNLNLSLRASDLYNMVGTSMTAFFMARQHLALIDRLLNADLVSKFVRHKQTVTIEWNWQEQTSVGMVLFFECFRVIDPDVYSDVWSDRWLRDYATALVKKQWGMNLLKLSGISLPGGVTLDADKINAEAKEEIKQLEEDLVLKYSLPVEFIVG